MRNVKAKSVSNIFATVINCMDGRVQLPVIECMKSRYGVDYVIIGLWVDENWEVSEVK